VVKEPVELFDIMPTIMELSNLPIKHNHFAKSLVSQLNGMKGDKKRTVFAEGGYNKNEPNCFEGYENRKNDVTRMQGHQYYPKGKQQQEMPESVCRSVMARTLTHKLIYRSQGTNELYDMKNDPNELINLYYKDDIKKIRDSLEKKLLKWYLDTSDVTPQDEHPRDFPF
ncbi:MAG: sulfatase/phosphatase domain-containing protein, partial [Bacillota bacterium]